MSDATKLPADQREAAMRSISADGLPEAIERQAAAGEHAAPARKHGRRLLQHSQRGAMPAALNSGLPAAVSQLGL